MARALLRCRVHLATQLVHEFQVLLKGHHAVHWIVRVALLHAYEKLRWQVQGQPRLVADRRVAAWLAVLCSSGSSIETVYHDVAGALVGTRELAAGRAHACWPVQVWCEGMQRVHCLRALDDARRHVWLRPLLSHALLINRDVTEHKANLLPEASASDVLCGIYGQCLLGLDLCTRHFVGVKAHGYVFRDVGLGGRQCLHDLLRSGLRQQDRVAHEAFLLLVGIVGVAQDNKPADHDGQT